MPKAHPAGEGKACAGPDCNRTESSWWYGKKPDGPFYCKKGRCYRKGKELGHISERVTGKRGREREPDSPATVSFDGPLTLVKLKHIVAQRFVSRPAVRSFTLVCH